MSKNAKENIKEQEQTPYVVTARKWRPMVFEDVVGQSHVTTTLRNAIATGRLHHSYIFSGPRGVGKTTTARILAKSLNCLNPGKDFNPDNSCELCQEITEGRSVNVFEIDGASNRGIDEVRNLRESVRYGPARGTYKIYIIDEAHMLTKEAWNALLKTLEEPPSYVVFIFATTEVQKIPATILSRCQRFDFRRNTIEEIAGRLRVIAKAEKIEIADDALLHIAKHADGSMRDGQSIFDQIVAFGGKSIDAKLVEQALNIVNADLFFRFSDILKSRSQEGVLALVDELVVQGVDLREFLQGLVEHFRNIMVTRLTKSTKLIETTEVHKKRYAEEAEAFTDTRMLRCINLANETDAALRFSRHPRYRLEVCLLMMLKLDDSMEIGELLQKLEEVKEQLKANPVSSNQGSFLTPQPANGATADLSRAGVRGSVRAGQPLLRPEQMVPPLIPAIVAASANNGGTSEPKAPFYDSSRTTSTVQTESAPVSMPSLDDVREKWDEVIAELRKRSKISVATIVSESKIIDLRGDRLRLKCPDQYSLDALQRNRELLTDVTFQVYGFRLRFDGVVGHTAPPDSEEPAQAGERPAEQKSEPVAGADMEHPVIQALIREVGARQVER